MISVPVVVALSTILSALLGSAAYVLGAVAYAKARAKRRGPDDIPPVSVIVAAHNGERTLPALFACLSTQTYSRDHIRIILADDRSEDRTSAIASDAAEAGLDIRVVRIDRIPDGVSPKKHALDAAITEAETELLLFTDADCRPEPDWIRAMAARLVTADVVLGLSPLAASLRSVDAWVRYESARTALLMVATAVAGHPYMALGRSWGYRRSLYERSGGLRPLFSEPGGDDDLLLQRFVRHGASVAICAEPGTSSPSDGPASIAALLRQKLRHFHASRRYTFHAKAGLAALHLAQLISFVFGPGTLIALGVAPLPVLALVAAKLAIDSQCVLSASPALPTSARRLLGIPLEWLYTTGSAVLGLTAQWKAPKW